MFWGQEDEPVQRPRVVVEGNRGPCALSREMGGNVIPDLVNHPSRLVFFWGPLRSRKGFKERSDAGWLGSLTPVCSALSRPGLPAAFLPWDSLYQRVSQGQGQRLQPSLVVLFVALWLSVCKAGRSFA